MFPLRFFNPLPHFFGWWPHFKIKYKTEPIPLLMAVQTFSFLGIYYAVAFGMEKNCHVI